jgi:predicted P-loop ATPase
VRLVADYVERAIDQIADENRFHPVRDYLMSLRWDGQARLDHVDRLVLHMQLKPIEKILLRKFFIAAAARAFWPGCKVDTVLVFVGKQAFLKSTFFKFLTGADWFSDTAVSVGDKDALLALRRIWVLEWAELDAVLRARDAETVKAFITSSQDTFRLPYARTTTVYQRTSIIVGTTNEDDFLVDPTGNRRFWPVRITAPIDIAAVAQLRDQLWAEAVEALRLKEPWHLTPGDEALLVDHQLDFCHVDAWAEAVEALLAQNPNGGISMADIFARALARSVTEVTPGDQKRVAAILRRAGWRRTQVRVGNQRPSLWGPVP